MLRKYTLPFENQHSGPPLARGTGPVASRHRGGRPTTDSHDSENGGLLTGFLECQREVM